MGQHPLFFILTIERIMSLDQHINDIIVPTLTDKGFRVVRAQLQGSKRKKLQIMIERIDDHNVTIDDCTLVSRTVSILLDLDDPIHESYTLEVTSPGLDRPLTQESDFQRFAGAMIRIELTTPYKGSRKFQGLLMGIEGGLVKIELDPQKEVAEFTFSDIQKARLIPDYEISRPS